MTDEPQPGLPFGFGQFDLGEVVRLLRSEGPLNLDVARQVAQWVALQGEDDAPVDPAEAQLMGELTRTAHLHVVDATGLGTGLAGEPNTLSRLAWGEEALGGLSTLLTALAQRLTAVPPEALGPDGGLGGELGPDGEPDLTNLLTAIAPLLLGVQAGFMVGHLASLSLGRHEMALPLSTPPVPTFVAPNIADFESDWQLPGDELRFYVAIHEVTYAVMMAVPWVQARLLRLTAEYVGAFEVDNAVMEARFAGLDPTNPETFEQALGDPTELLGAMRSPAQREILGRISLLTALMEGYADSVLAEVGPPLIPSFERIREACHRHRVERGEAAKFLEALLGLEIARADLDRATAFCRGVTERAGSAGLRRLFADETHLPTPSELDAPGLWLERLDLPPAPSS